MFLLREVRPSDLDELYELADRLNTLNLQADRDVLEDLISSSRASFGHKFEDPMEREYVFVLRDLDAGRVIGTCMIIAQHGSYDRPSVYFNVREEQKYSATLGKHFVHQVLELSFNYDGPTEIGGLILHPDYRGHPLKLGKLLSFVRFLYIGMHEHYFRDELVAELLPPLNPDKTSDLWDSLGRKFTDLDYIEADKMSRENIEFIRNLFPFYPIYTALLPEHVRKQIGQVGEPTKPVEKMLRKIGFRWDRSIDPFDGGPTFRVLTPNCEAVRRVQWETFAGGFDPDEETPHGIAMIGFEYESHLVRFRATYGPYRRTEDGGVLFHSEGMNLLRMEPGDEIGFLPFTGPGLTDL
jgi:arginine N-succinyltransferase